MKLAGSYIQSVLNRLGGVSTGLFCVLASSASFAQEEHKKGLPQFDPTWYPSQLFWLAVCFIILYLFFSSKTLPEIGGVLENRKSLVAKDLFEAEKMKADAEAAQQSYEGGLAHSQAETTRLLNEAHEWIKHRNDEQVAEFRNYSEHEVKALEVRIANAKKGAMDDMSTIAAEVAAEAAEKIVGIPADTAHAKTVVKSLQNKEAA